MITILRTPRIWANELRSVVEGQVADCCLDGMSDDEKRDSIQDMILDCCESQGFPDDMIEEVANILNPYI